MDDFAFSRLRDIAEQRTSDWFEPHDDQMVSVNRGDLRWLLTDYKDKLNGYNHWQSFRAKG